MSVTKTDLEASSGEDSRSADVVVPLTADKNEVLGQTDDDFPDGGLKAWSVVAGGASIFFCCLGFGSSFGTFQAYNLDHQLKDQSPDSIAWIGSVSAFLPFASGVIGGPMFDRYGAWLVRPGTLLYLLSMMMLSLCKTYWQIMLVQGVLMGISMAFLQFPAFAAAGQYFKKKRASALGIMVAGSSIGGIVMPMLLSKMLNSSSLSFGWSVRVVGFFIMPFLLFACVAVRPRLPPRKNRFWITDVYRNTSFMLFCTSFFFVLIGMFTPIFFLPTYAVRRGMGATLAGYLPAILNAASTFGRVIPGVLADKFGPINIFFVGGIATGIVIFCFDRLETNAALIGYSVVFGFVSGTLISGASAAIAVFVKDVRDIGTYMGMGMAFSSFGILIGPPVSGVFVKTYGGFFELAMFSGSMCLFGGILAIATKSLTPQGLFGRT